VLSLTQQVPLTPGQPEKPAGAHPAAPCPVRSATGAHHGEELVVLTGGRRSFAFPAGPRPVLSINRGFSAPVVIEADMSLEDLVFLAAHDDDPFARRGDAEPDRAPSGRRIGRAGRCAPRRRAIAAAMRAILKDPALDDLMRANC
jgi:aminopeptidase N